MLRFSYVRWGCLLQFRAIRRLARLSPAGQEAGKQLIKSPYPENPIYTVTLEDRDFQLVEMEIEAAIQGANMRIVNVIDIKKGLNSRGDEFPEYKIFEFCNLGDAAILFPKAWNFGAFVPCKIFIYEKGKDVVAGTYLNTHALRYLPDDPDVVRVTKNIEKQILDIINSL